VSKESISLYYALRLSSKSARPSGSFVYVFSIFVPYTALNLDLDLGKADPGTIIKLSSRRDGSKQRWRFEILGDFVQVPAQRRSGDGSNVCQ
jgi:hypothetical protein